MDTDLLMSAVSQYEKATVPPASASTSTLSQVLSQQRAVARHPSERAVVKRMCRCRSPI